MQNLCRTSRREYESLLRKGAISCQQILYVWRKVSANILREMIIVVYHIIQMGHTLWIIYKQFYHDICSKWKSWHMMNNWIARWIQYIIDALVKMVRSLDAVPFNFLQHLYQCCSSFMQNIPTWCMFLFSECIFLERCPYLLLFGIYIYDENEMFPNSYCLWHFSMHISEWWALLRTWMMIIWCV